MNRAGSYLWGRFADPNGDGFPIRLLWDSVLPYSVPSPEPGWWETGASGQFTEGYQRNLEVDIPPTPGWPNFPASRHLNAVKVAMIGLKQSEVAPFRFTQSTDLKQPEIPRDDAVWPFDFQASQPTWVPAPAVEVLRTYASADPTPYYLTGDTKLVVALPERDVMNAIGAAEDGCKWSELPDNENGLKAIEELIVACLLPVAETGLGLADKILAWFLIDEPDLIYRRRWATPGRLAKLRAFVKETEWAFRVESDPSFASLSLTEQKKRLRPTMITLTAPFFLDEEGALDIQEWRNGRFTSPNIGLMTGAADIFAFDWYPYKRSRDKINKDYNKDTCSSPPPVQSPAYKRVDPVRSIRALRDMRQRLNGSLQPGDDNYRPVLLWSQTDGYPFRTDSDGVSSDRSPAAISTEDVDGCKVASGRRTKQYPSKREQQYYNWAGLLELSEGTAGFSQFNAPDRRLKDDFSDVLRETEYFGGLRYNSIDQSRLIVSRALGHGTPAVGDSRDRMSPAVLYVDYLNQPESALGASNRWLIIINRHFLRLVGVLRFSSEGFSGGFRCRRINYLESVDTPTLVGPTNGFTFSIDVPFYGVRIYQQVPA